MAHALHEIGGLFRLDMAMDVDREMFLRAGVAADRDGTAVRTA